MCESVCEREREREREIKTKTKTDRDTETGPIIRRRHVHENTNLSQPGVTQTCLHVTDKQTELPENVTATNYYVN